MFTLTSATSRRIVKQICVPSHFDWNQHKKQIISNSFCWHRPPNGLHTLLIEPGASPLGRRRENIAFKLIENQPKKTNKHRHIQLHSTAPSVCMPILHMNLEHDAMSVLFLTTTSWACLQPGFHSQWASAGISLGSYMRASWDHVEILSWAKWSISHQRRCDLS